jgi:dUTP pyrophosphatase
MSNHHLNIPTLIEDESNLPSYASTGAAGADVRAHLSQDLVIAPGTSALIPTGMRFAIPEGYEIQVRPRSGLALKNQITVLNTPGTIDSDYRGEVGVILMNHSKEEFIVRPGMRIAQIVLAPVVRANFVVSADLAITERGQGGFGHTGCH